MRCRHCRTRFRADRAQPAPGGSSAPEMFLIGALAFLAASVAAHLLAPAYLGWALLAIAAALLVKVPIAWSDCRRATGLATHGGGTCPGCGGHNVVRPWSL